MKVTTLFKNDIINVQTNTEKVDEIQFLLSVTFCDNDFMGLPFTRTSSRHQSTSQIYV